MNNLSVLPAIEKESSQNHRQEMILHKGNKQLQCHFMYFPHRDYYCVFNGLTQIVCYLSSMPHGGGRGLIYLLIPTSLDCIRRPHGLDLD